MDVYYMSARVLMLIWNRSLIGQLDVEKDKATDLASIRVEPIPETRHI